jgi:hypothetical protein
MAKQPKQTARDAKIHALDTFTSLLREEPTKERHKKRFLSRGKMQSDNEVRQRFTKYANAIEAFNQARMANMQAKISLQRLMDVPLYESKLINERKFWDCGIDDKGNFWFKNDPKSFEERWKDFKRQIKSEQAYDDADIFFDKEGSGTSADMSEDTLEGTSESTASGTVNYHMEVYFQNDPQAFLEEWRTKPPEQQTAIYRGELNDTERRDFFEMLTKDEQRSLYDQLTEMEKLAVKMIMDTPQTPTTSKSIFNR